MPTPAIDFSKIINQALPTFEFAGKTLGDVINALVPYIFALAGIILFFLLIWGGFEFMTSGGDPKKVELARGKITHAIIGFTIIFIAYWLVQILETIFGIQIF